MKTKTGAYKEDRRVHKLFMREDGKYYRLCRPSSSFIKSSLIFENWEVDCQMCKGSRSIYNRFINGKANSN